VRGERGRRLTETRGSACKKFPAIDRGREGRSGEGLLQDPFPCQRQAFDLRGGRNNKKKKRRRRKREKGIDEKEKRNLWTIDPWSGISGIRSLYLHTTKKSQKMRT